VTSEALAPRRALVRRAMLLEAAIISYNIFEGVVSIVAGILAGSIALVGFGLDSGIEVAAAVVVLFHLARSGDDVQEEWEQRVAVFVGITLLAVAAYVFGRALYNLAAHIEAEESYLGIAITTASLVLMPLVSRIQHSLSHQIESRALEADSRETLVCTYLSAAALAGLGANAALGWWWADPAAALVMVGVIAREGWEAITRRELCCID